MRRYVLRKKYANVVRLAHGCVLGYEFQIKIEIAIEIGIEYHGTRT